MKMKISKLCSVILLEILLPFMWIDSCVQQTFIRQLQDSKDFARCSGGYKGGKELTFIEHILCARHHVGPLIIFSHLIPKTLKGRNYKT